MLPYSEWLHLAKALPEGTRKRVNHTCGAGRTMILNHDEQGYSAHCFRCNDWGSKGHGERRLSDLFKARAEELFEAQEVQLPEDFVLMPECKDYMAHVWLAQAGITQQQQQQYKIGYSPGIRRVILPVYEQDELVYTQARALRGEKPKYLNPAADRSRLLFLSRGTYTQGPVVLTEDILSAIRVGSFVQTASLMGTDINEAQAHRLILLGSPVVVWLDGDKAGLKGAASVRRMLDGLVPVHLIQTEKDPKCYTNREIQEILIHDT